MRSSVDSGVYTINEARAKLGEVRVDAPEADKLLILTEKAGWVQLDNTPVSVRVEPLLPRAFARLATVPDESERSA